MGKKRSREQLVAQPVEEQEDEELESEMKALAQMRSEKNPTTTNAISEPIVQYNREGLLKSIEGRDLPFEESMQICEFAVEIQDENDDLERELAFYNQTLRAVEVGKQRLEGLGVPIRRPVDYFCEQVKSDAHMAKVKDRLLVEEKKIEGFEKRLQRDSNRKFNKQVANVKKEEKSKTANKMVSDVTKVRKGYNKEGVEEGLKKILGEDGERKKGLKRVNMDKKYGFGGKDHKKNKINTAKSINDLSDFNPRGGKFVRRDDAMKGKKKGKPNRPGKATRDQKRTPSRS